MGADREHLPPLLAGGGGLGGPADLDREGEDRLSHQKIQGLVR